MQNNRQKKGANAFVISIVMHLVLFGLLIVSSFYHTVEIMGGGEGDGDAMGAVMVDTSSAAQEWGRIQQQKKGQADKQKRPEPVVEEKLEHLSSILQQEMDNIRLTIHQMYDDSFSLSQRMDTLLQPLKEKVQVNFTNTISDSIPITIKYDILTICKELTTNFMKHSNGTQIQLFLLEQKTTYTIDYRDNGDRPTNTPSGMGLTMMKELVEKHNGDFTLQTKNGYEIFIRIPKQEASHD